MVGGASSKTVPVGNTWFNSLSQLLAGEVGEKRGGDAAGQARGPIAVEAAWGGGAQQLVQPQFPTAHLQLGTVRKRHARVLQHFRRLGQCLFGAPRFAYVDSDILEGNHLVGVGVVQLAAFEEGLKSTVY